MADKKQPPLVFYPIAMLMTVPLFLVFSLVTGWVVNTLWGMFVTPTWGGPTPGVPACAGLSLIVGALKGPNPYRSGDDEPGLGMTVFREIAKPLMCLAVGYCIVFLFGQPH